MTAVASSWLAGVNSLLPTVDRGLSVFAYHLVDGGTEAVVDISRADFEHQLDCIASNATVVDLVAGVDAARAGRVQGHSVVLTFDDAFENFAEVIWPILERRRLPATLFVPVDFVNGGSSPLSGGEHLRPCTWSALREIAESGLVAIGSHTMTHRNLRRLDLAEVRRECVDSRRALEDNLDVSVQSFCYPQAKWTRAVAAEVARHYRVGVVAGGRVITGAAFDSSAVPRFPITRGSCSTFEHLFRRRVWVDEALRDLVRQYR